ncbi:hypothetical protein [Clostridium tunisiense]|uniref:hypothetical protein n=1 Tax=Clostridium tunisiense TaxID=219748 RepID=UPI0002E9D782|nr:hypothetical protein [Clostridium tunisiense]
MKDIIFVTSNKGKIATAQSDLKNIRVLPYEAELIEPRSDDIREIAEQKVYQAYEIVKKTLYSFGFWFFYQGIKRFS